MTAEYKLQLNKVVDLEDKILKHFSKDKWKEYLYLDIEKGQLHSIEVDQIIEFVVKFLNCNIKLISYFYHQQFLLLVLSNLFLLPFPIQCYSKKQV
jgi:hypothetical protein